MSLETPADFWCPDCGRYDYDCICPALCDCCNGEGSYEGEDDEGTPVTYPCDWCEDGLVPQPRFTLVIPPSESA